MSPFDPLPLRSHDPAWEQRWTEEHKISMVANARLQVLASEPVIGWDQYALALEAAAKSGARLQKAFTAQFRNTDEYRDWQVNWLPTLLPWPELREIQARMPGGLPIMEIRRRMNDAVAFGRRAESTSNGRPSHPDEHQIRHILGTYPSGEVFLLVDLLRRGGGDYA